MLDDVPPGAFAALSLIARRWRFVAVCMVAAALAAVAYARSRPRQYAAAALLTTMGSQRPIPAVSGLAAGLLGTAQGAGMQATPAFLGRLAKLPGVLRAVGLSPMNPAGGGERIIEHYLRRRIVDTTDAIIPDVMNGAIRVGLDEPTGLLTVSAAHVDSALARRLVEATIESASRAFVQATHAQAAVMRKAQAQRIDSASRQLRAAEGALREFLSANRVIAPYSAAAIEQIRLQRQFELAQSVYNQSVAERQAAIARELDETPALVVLDPVAPRLSLQPRRTKLYVALALVLAFLASATWVLARAALARPGASSELPRDVPRSRVPQRAVQ